MNNIMKRSNGDSKQPATTFSGLVDQLFDTSFNKMLNDSFGGFRGNLSRNMPPVNVKETDKTFELEMVVPGFKKGDFKVDLSGDTLTVSLEHKEENKDEDKDAGWLRQEYRRQAFSRSFNLDNTIDANKIVAKYEDGLLHLTLPKKNGAQRISKSITIE
ncbi:MAG: Hsp20/alpha crystallin family protein [Flavipsychrobacter sp.]|jgi:HSP20 family protein|nr:Hsp20/alpha crystallin family protein [Flavipsychrobacter sp.]